MHTHLLIVVQVIRVVVTAVLLVILEVIKIGDCIMIEWNDIDECKPKNMSRVLVDIGGYTQSNILIYINDVWYRDDVSDRVEYGISYLISRWCYLPLSPKDTI